MAQIRKGFIADNAIDGTKLKLLNNEAVRAANADGSDAELMKLDSSNVLQFLKLPQVSADPSAANDVSRKSYVDTTVSTAVEAEATARAAADSAEASARAAAVSAEASARSTADGILQDNIDAEASARAAAISSEAGARSAADSQLASDLSAEVSARQSADTQLGQDLATEVSARQAAISSEASARSSADSQLASDLAGEVSARQSADTVLDGKIATEKGRIDAILAASSADKDSFAEIVSLINSVDTSNDQAFASYVLSNDAALAAETSARQSADSTLQSNISAEASARASAVSSEASARQSADTTLQSNIDAEVAARAAAVSAEASARSSADSAEQSARQAADAALQAAILALATTSLTDVSTSSKVNGDLFQWDSTTSKWKNVAPVSAGGTVTTGAPSTVSLLRSEGAGGYNDGAIFGPGQTFFLPGWTGGSWYYEVWAGFMSGSTSASFNKMSIKLARMSENNSTWYFSGVSDLNTGTMKLVLNTSKNSLSSPIAESTSVNLQNIPLNNQDWIDFSFVDANVTLSANTQYYVHYVFSNPTKVALLQKVNGTGEVRTGWATYSNGQTGEYDGLAARVYTGTAGNQVTSTITGVIKTNTGGFLDKSFLAYDVDFGGHKLQGVSAPSAGTDAANKTYVDGQVSSEASARSAADTTLQSNISAEASARQSADTTLQSNITAEASARSAADTTLQNNITAEASARAAADSTETAARQAADTVLDGKIATEKGRIDAILSASTADKDSFAEIVSLINSVDTENDTAFASYVLSNNAALAAETAARQAADTSEASARAAADSAETAARQAADSAEASARAAADSAEQSAREAADAALDTRLDVLEAIQHRKEKFTLTSTDISNGYVDLAVSCIVDSEMVFVGSLYVHSGDDYSVSTVGGKTRLTWSGELVQNGPSKLMVGDIVYVRYMK